MSAYNIISSKTIFDHPMARIIIDTLEHDGVERPYFYLVSPVEAVATVGMTDTGEILLTRQYRHPVRQVIYDLPAGRLDPGEDPLEGARREFEEETGFFPRQMEKLGYYNQFPGTLCAGTHLFFGSNLIPTRQNLDEGEFLEIIPMPIVKVLGLIKKDKIIDGSLQLGMLLAQLKGLLPVEA